MQQLQITRGIRTSLRTNSSAYAYSVLITATLSLRQGRAGPPSPPELFLFAVGAALAFAGMDALASNLFRQRMRGDSPDVVVLGSALAVVSISLALAAAWLVSELVENAVGWLLTAFVATAVYLVAAGLEMAFARWEEERHPPDQSPPS